MKVNRTLSATWMKAIPSKVEVGVESPVDV